MNLYKLIMVRTLLLVVILMTSSFSLSYAQKFLNKPVSIVANRQPVAEVLKTIGQEGGFYFSYNSDVIPGDSLVTFSIRNQPLRLVLDGLLQGRFLYKETGQYIILQRAPVEKFFQLMGRITDVETGKPVDYVSVYSKSVLVSTLTDNDGTYRLKIKDPIFPITVNISKIGYADTTVIVRSERDAKLNLQMSPRAVDLDEVMVYNSGADRTWLARLFVSSRLRAQSRNIGKFFVSLPYQLSLTPGLGTHGRMSTQVTNKVSLNLIGGYTAGVDGVELAGAFNISKSNVRVAQVAGVFNIVAGSVQGVQMAGVSNQVMESVKGLQVAGAGNQVSKTVEGVQLAGAINRVKGRIHGAQISGLANIGKEEVQGVQVSTINYAKILKGVQIGIVNVADSSSGYSIGIINFIRNGKGSLSLFANEIVPVNIAWKTGSPKIYSILTAGTGIGRDNKTLTWGFGFGKDFRLNKSMIMSTEIVSHSAYIGDWNKTVGIYRLQTLLDLRLGKGLSLSAGPSIAVSPDKNLVAKDGFKNYPPKTYTSFNLGHSTAGWFGWQAGISWNYGSVL